MQCSVLNLGRVIVDLYQVLSFSCSWSVTTPEFRSGIMRKIADLIESQLEEFAEAESRDQGKPVMLAKKVDIPRACLNFRFFASSIINASSSNQ